MFLETLWERYSEVWRNCNRDSKSEEGGSCSDCVHFIDIVGYGLGECEKTGEARWFSDFVLSCEDFCYRGTDEYREYITKKYKLK